MQQAIEHLSILFNTIFFFWIPKKEIFHFIVVDVMKLSKQHQAPAVFIFYRYFEVKHK